MVLGFDILVSPFFSYFSPRVVLVWNEIFKLKVFGLKGVQQKQNQKNQKRKMEEVALNISLNLM